MSVDGQEVELTPTEYDLLRALSLNAGRVTTYEALLDQIWSERREGGWKVVRAFVKQLRAKLGDGRGRSCLDLQRPRRRLPHAPARRDGPALTAGNNPTSMSPGFLATFPHITEPWQESGRR